MVAAESVRADTRNTTCSGRCRVRATQTVAAMAVPVLIHRMALTFAARASGESLEGLIASTVANVTRVEAAA